MANTDEVDQVTNTAVTPEVEASIGEKLAGISDAHGGIEGSEAVSEEVDSAQPGEVGEVAADKEAAEVGGGEPDPNQSAEDESETETQSAEQPVTDATPTLPAAQIRSLKAYGWSDEEIATAIDTPNFAATAARIHQNRTQEIQDWAAHGRAQKEATQEKQDVDEGVAVPKQLDTAALKEKYGSEELIDELTGPLNAALAQFHTLLPNLQAGQQVAEQAKVDAARDSVESFFTADSLKVYADAYGASGSMNEEQYGNRVQLLQVADDIRTGAGLRNQDMSIHEAMGYAHEIVGSSFKTTAVRNEIRGKVKKRASGVSLKPGTELASKTAAGGDLSEQQIEKNARERLDALGA